MAPSTTSPATLPQPSPHHNPLPYYGTALEPWQTAAMVIARANQDLARRRLVFGSLRRDDLVTEYNWALDRLVTSGVCRLAAPPKVVPADREAWLQTQQQEIEAWVQGQASPDGPRLTETELAQMGLLPARGLPPGLSPHQRPAVQAHLAKLATMPGDFWIGAPMIYAREVLFTVIVRGGPQLSPKQSYSGSPARPISGRSFAGSGDRHCSISWPVSTTLRGASSPAWRTSLLVTPLPYWR